MICILPRHPGSSSMTATAAGTSAVITSNRLDDLWENQQVPTLEAVQRQFSKETSEKQQELFTVAMKQWQTENTQLYFLVKDSIIISGDWETLDRETIKNRFTSGRLRDGLAFIAWVNSFHDYTSEDGQIAQISAGAGLGQDSVVF